jgi:hypothetical protein
MPAMIRYFVSSLGRDSASCSDLMSYLLFTSKYTRDLIEIGYHDADERIEEIEEFLYASGDQSTVERDSGDIAPTAAKTGMKPPANLSANVPRNPDRFV